MHVYHQNKNCRIFGKFRIFAYNLIVVIFSFFVFFYCTEVPGEDPFLTSQYVIEYSNNMQFSENSPYLKVVSTAKHYCDYDQEGNWGTDRGSFDANVSEQDQVEYYWPAWRYAIQSGNVQSIMCSYNAVNGIPSCGNDYFMNEIARQEYGFDGYFVSGLVRFGFVWFVLVC